MVRPRSCRVIYYFDTPTLEIRHQLFDRVTLQSLPLNMCDQTLMQVQEKKEKNKKTKRNKSWIR